MITYQLTDKLSKKQKRQIVSASVTFIKQHIGTLKAQVIISDTPPETGIFTQDGYSTLGTCTTYVYGDNLCPYKFHIWFSTKISYEEMLTTIFHELTHVQQYTSLNLVHIEHLKDGKTRYFWKDEMYDLNMSEHTVYLDAPWEIEARKVSENWRKRWNKYSTIYLLTTIYQRIQARMFSRVVL